MPDRDIQYERPPVIERVIGVQFDPLKGLSSGNFGKFWSTLDQTEWPISTDAQELPLQYEHFGEGAQFPLDPHTLQLQFSQVPRLRVQIRNALKDRIIQLQNGRFHLNWLRAGGDVDYPRFPTIKSEFLNHWQQFRQFSEQQSLGNLKPNQWEVTYLNHIPQGPIWNSPEDWSFFKPLDSVSPKASPLPLQNFNGEWSYEIPEQKGRLHVRWQHTSRNETKLIVITMTARGPLSGESVEELTDGLDCGRRHIVESFASLMDDKANAYWGMK